MAIRLTNAFFLAVPQPLSFRKRLMCDFLSRLQMADSAAVTARILELEAIGNTHIDVKEGYFAICLCNVYFDLQIGAPMFSWRVHCDH